MVASSKEEINKTKDDEFRIPCTECSGKTWHKILLSVDLSGDDIEGDYRLDWDAHYQIVKCRGCESISFRETSSNSEASEINSEGEWEEFIYEDLYPPRFEGRNGISDTVYLPPKIQRVYKETLKALNSKSPILTGIGLRALIETVCKEKSAEGSNLLVKIDDLVTKNVMTPSGASILHKIRALGNIAAHEVTPHSDKQLSLAMDVIEHILNDVYILPKQIVAEFDED